MKEVTANILKLEQDNCSKRSLCVIFSDKCYALTINIQMLSLCCEQDKHLQQNHLHLQL